MNPRPVPRLPEEEVSPTVSPPSERPRAATRLDALEQRVERNERQLLQLRNTLAAIAREAAHVSVGGPCLKCGESLMLIKEGRMSCPRCGYQHSM